jgi:hypothetical protein
MHVEHVRSQGVSNVVEGDIMVDFKITCLTKQTPLCKGEFKTLLAI